MKRIELNQEIEKLKDRDRVLILFKNNKEWVFCLQKSEEEDDKFSIFVKDEVKLIIGLQLKEVVLYFLDKKIDDLFYHWVKKK